MVIIIARERRGVGRRRPVGLLRGTVRDWLIINTYIYIYIYICIHIYIYIYIYIHTHIHIRISLSLYIYVQREILLLQLYYYSNNNIYIIIVMSLLVYEYCLLVLCSYQFDVLCCFLVNYMIINISFCVVCFICFFIYSVQSDSWFKQYCFFTFSELVQYAIVSLLSCLIFPVVV